MYFVIRCFILSSVSMEYIDWECHNSLKIKKMIKLWKYGIYIYIYMILSFLSVVLPCIHWAVDTNKRWYFYPIYYSSSNTPRSIVYKSNYFRTETLHHCVFHQGVTFKGQQHYSKAYHDTFLKSDRILQLSMVSVLIIMIYV